LWFARGGPSSACYDRSMSRSDDGFKRRGRLPAAVVLGVLAAAVLFFSAIGLWRYRALRERDSRVQPPTPIVVATPAPDPLDLYRVIDPATVDHQSRFHFTFDTPKGLAPLRREESLDEVVGGGPLDQEKLLRLMRWTRAQWEPGRPDPYPPFDAREILDLIRSGRTSGFCAQYAFVLVQAIQSFGVPARGVTITGHEVIEAWLVNEERWVMLDPHHELVVLDKDGRMLSALEIRLAGRQGRSLRMLEGHSYPGTRAEYLNRYRRLAIWLRNDHVSRPMNYMDLERYRVWFNPGRDNAFISPASLVTVFAGDLYPEGSFREAESEP